MNIITDFSDWTPEQIIAYAHQMLGTRERSPEEWAAYYEKEARKEREQQKRLKELYETGRYLIYKRKCPVCGTDFYTGNPRRIYDDYYTCSRYVHRENAKEKRKFERFTKCEECGRYFTPQRAGAKYCSSACKQKGYRKRKMLLGQNVHTQKA